MKGNTEHTTMDRWLVQLPAGLCSKSVAGVHHPILTQSYRAGADVSSHPTEQTGPSATQGEEMGYHQGCLCPSVWLTSMVLPSQKAVGGRYGRGYKVTRLPRGGDA
jgi:hypothetical protein